MISETIKISEENIGGKLPNVGLGNDFRAVIPKADPKNKHERMRLQQTIKFLHSKGKQIKHDPIDWGKKYLQTIYLARGWYQKYKGMKWHIVKKHYFKFKNMQRTWIDSFPKYIFKRPWYREKVAQYH